MKDGLLLYEWSMNDKLMIELGMSAGFGWMDYGWMMDYYRIDGGLMMNDSWMKGAWMFNQWWMKYG
jgi:hypothetical protein